MATILDQCREKIEKATPGPWERSSEPQNELEWVTNPTIADICLLRAIDYRYLPTDTQANNAEFIAFSRTVMPILVERLEKAIQAIRKLESDGAPMFADELEAPIDVRKE